jgi:hypothetical protein
LTTLKTSNDKKINKIYIPLCVTAKICYNYIVIATLPREKNMHIEKFTVRQRPYLRLVESKRRLSRNGKPISGKTLVLSLGPLSQHDDGKPDYIERLRKSFREGNPLIEALRPYVGDAPKEQWNVTFTAGDIRCFGEPKRLAPCVLDPIFSAIGLDQFFASVKHSSKMHYDLQGIVKLLVYGRLLNPASKWATMLQNKDYLSPIAKKYKDDNVYDALTVIDKKRTKDISSNEYVSIAWHRKKPFNSIL